MATMTVAEKIAYYVEIFALTDEDAEQALIKRYNLQYAPRIMKQQKIYIVDDAASYYNLNVNCTGGRGDATYHSSCNITRKVTDIRGVYPDLTGKVKISGKIVPVEFHEYNNQDNEWSVEY